MSTTKKFICKHCGLEHEGKGNILRLSAQGIFRNRTKDVPVCDQCAKSISAIRLTIVTGALERVA